MNPSRSIPAEPISESESHLEVRTAQIAVDVAGHRIEMSIQASIAPTSPAELLPIYRTMADTIIGFAVEAVESGGYTISCRKGCGACCRQLVPITEVEARWIAEYVAALPEPRRSEIRTRFDRGRERLVEAGLYEPLRAAPVTLPDDLIGFAMDYFRLGIPCPFLDDESCSIHVDRPIICREYLVVSPPEHCEDPSPETIRRIEIPGRVSLAAGRLGQETGARDLPWVPLLLALEWAEEHTEPLPFRPGTELLEEFFTRLASRTGEAVSGIPPVGDIAAGTHPPANDE